ncbi:hypothetical protein LPJ59_002188 [Coemansia sp. RSA 2399]|nr:hypothetical protein LPJ59_002188 [Coemansia sp. RSA 2399]KAJ1889487.1 hypothetical protein LPJ81_006118 [Coemansia sp. IMI 209127]
MAAAGTKRPASDDADDDGSTQGSVQAKKAALDKAPATPTKKTEAAIPTNKTMPTDYSFIAATDEDRLKIVSFNVNSLPAACKKGFKEYVAAEDADIVCVQETKVNQAMMFLLSKKTYPHEYWHCSKTKKGYSGTAVFSKIKPLKTKYGLGDMDTEGRVITLEYASFFLVACYVPNAGEKLVRLDRRMQWDVAMAAHLAELEKTKPVVYTGDLNVAHHPVDLARPETNKRSAGFTIEERDGFTELLKGSSGVPRVDVFRALNPDARASGYTYFGYRANCREKAIGWRLDYFVVSQPLMPRVRDIFVRNQCYGASDHVPLVLLLKRDEEPAAESEEKSDVAKPEEKSDVAKSESKSE